MGAGRQKHADTQIDRENEREVQAHIYAEVERLRNREKGKEASVLIQKRTDNTVARKGRENTLACHPVSLPPFVFRLCLCNQTLLARKASSA